MSVISVNAAHKFSNYYAIGLNVNIHKIKKKILSMISVLLRLSVNSQTVALTRTIGSKQCV
jgi:hypothetical protein